MIIDFKCRKKEKERRMTMKKIIGFLATLTFVLTLFMAGNMVVDAAEGVDDTEPAVLTSIKCTSNFDEIKDTITNKSNLIFDVSYTDDYGISKIIFEFTDEDNLWFPEFEFTVSEDESNVGNLRLTYHLSDSKYTFIPGEKIHLYSVEIYDVDGNLSSYSLSDDDLAPSLESEMKAIQFTVIDALSNTIDVDTFDMGFTKKETESKNNFDDTYEYTDYTMEIGHDTEGNVIVPAPIYARIPICNNTYQTYTLDTTQSTANWTLTSSEQSYNITGSFFRMINSEGQETTTLEYNDYGYVYFKINPPVETAPSGEVKLNSISFYGKKANSETMLLTYCLNNTDKKTLVESYGPEGDLTSSVSKQYDGWIDFTIDNVDEDHAAPEIVSITNLTKQTSAEIYTGDSVNIEVEYKDAKSDVQEIILTYADKNGKNFLTGSAYNTVGEQTNLLGKEGKTTISLSSDGSEGSASKDAIGTWTIYSITISDVCGNTVTYTNNKCPYEWADWRDNTSFERVLDGNTARILKAVLKDVPDKDNVNPGSTINLDITIRNTGEKSFTTDCWILSWGVSGKDPTQETCITVNKEVTIPVSTDSSGITIPISLPQNEVCGERTFSSITLEGKTSDGPVIISLEKQSNGSFRQYYNNNRTYVPVTSNVNMDYSIHAYEIITEKATPTQDGAVEDKCTLCQEVRSTKEIPHPENITLSSTEFMYNGNVQTPTVTVTDRNGDLIPDTDYTVTYANGRVAAGQYDVTITFKNNYSGTVTRTFTIKNLQTPTSPGGNESNGGNGTSSNNTVNNTPTSYTTNNTTVPTIKGTKISSVKSAAKKITVKWKKQTKNTTGYQIQYSLKKTFKSGVKTKTIKKNKTTSVVLKKLKSKKTYYIRIRTYQNTTGETYYSTWSPVKKIKVK